MANRMLKLKIDPNLVWFGFGCKSLCCLNELKLFFLWFLVMAASKMADKMISHGVWSPMVSST